MSEYIAPLREMRFVLTELAGLDEISSLPGFEDATPDTVEAVLEEAGKFAAGVLAPLNRVGDLQGARWENGHVSTPPQPMDIKRRRTMSGVSRRASTSGRSDG